MATSTEIDQVWSWLATQYPRWHREQSAEVLNQLLRGWELLLADVPALTLKKAAVLYRRRRRFWPEISELVEISEEIDPAYKYRTCQSDYEELPLEEIAMELMPPIQIDIPALAEHSNGDGARMLALEEAQR